MALLDICQACITEDIFNAQKQCRIISPFQNESIANWRIGESQNYTWPISVNYRLGPNEPKWIDNAIELWNIECYYKSYR
jgi:hypothetical protein